MKVKNAMLFTYDFPHKKTQDFIFNLLISNYKIKYVIAAPKVKLNIPTSDIKINPIHEGLIHPSKICQYFNIPYYRYNHNSHNSVNLLKLNPVDLYIIAGARILSKEIIEASGNKILNIHPGLLPHVRGLDTLLWSIYYDQPIGISAHFISSKIDLGLLIYKEKLKLNKDDLIRDVSLRLLEKQSEILLKSINYLKNKDIEEIKNIDLSQIKYNTKMSKNLEIEVIKKYNSWLINNLK